MVKLRTLGLAALSLAVTAAMAQGPRTGDPGPDDCRGGGCDSVMAEILSGIEPGDEALHPGRAFHEPLAGVSRFGLSLPIEAPLLHSASFEALAGLAFDGAGPVPRAHVPDFVELPWEPFPLPPAANPGAHGKLLPGPAAPPRAIPEPNIYALMLAGLAAGAWASRRRRR